MMQIKYMDRPIAPVWLLQPHYTLGRSAICDVQLNDETLNEVHAHLRFDIKQNSLILAQEGDASICVNNTEISGEVRLTHGDVLAMGSHKLMIVDSKWKPQSKQEDAWKICSQTSLTHGDKRQQAFSITSMSIVGRSSKCDIHIDEGTLSRRHAKLSVINSQLIVEDLNSSNGTYINGEPVVKGFAKHGDDIAFANIKFRVQDPFFDEEEDKTSLVHIESVDESAPDALPMATGPTAIEKQQRTFNKLKKDGLTSPSYSGKVRQKPAENTVSRATTNEKSHKSWLVISLLVLAVGLGAWLLNVYGLIHVDALDTLRPPWKNS